MVIRKLVFGKFGFFPEKKHHYGGEFPDYNSTLVTTP